MSITLSSAITDLRKGAPLTWDASGSFKGGTIHLDKASQRRLFNFLVEQSMDEVIVASESLFNGLTEAWKDKESDPASNEVEIQETTTNGPWRLTRIEATGFGGLNTPDGPPFELDVGGENWCLEGYNGSGKTSLASLILWTLTGYRNREQDGPLKDTGIRETVTNGSKKIGTWPPLVTYPSKSEDLKKSAYVSATLTFIDPTGEQATATREVESPVDGDPILVETIDPRLLASPELIETGLLMPARIGHIGFGSKSKNLHQALKMLTGLDKLAAIGMGAAAFGHGAKRFLKYAKENGINEFEQAFSVCLKQAREHAENTSIDFTKQYKLGAEKLIEELTAIEEDASTKAGAALSLLKIEIADEIDVDDGNDRNRLNNAVSKTRVYLDEGSKSIPLFTEWSSLTQAGKEGFSDVSGDLDAANAALSKALEWHTKQENDQKLRLKALASTFCVREDLLSGDANCPLCETKLTSAAQLILATELADLKAESEHAERAISDACSDIEITLKRLMPNSLSSHFESLATMEPAKAFSSAIKERFSSESPFNDILTGIGTFVASYAVDKANDLPSFSHTPVTYEPSTIVCVGKLQSLMVKIARVSALAAWWTDNRIEFISAWKELIGEKNAENEWPINCLQGKIRTLEEAIEESGPLDKIATQIGKAKKAATSWTSIQAVQKVREEIVVGLEPLKKLQQLVDCQTHHTVMTLRDRVEVILNNIRLKGPLSFKSTEITKKAVTVEGSFAEGMQIDAALVANSSWLRALLWAFIFALREQTIEDLGSNTFPLIVLDDPQTTFDPRNKRKWAEEIVGIANLDQSDPKGMQLFLTTHERQFYDIICQTCELECQEGKMAGPTSTTGVAHIVNGTFLDRQFEKAQQDVDDYEGFKYVQQVRIYCEDLLRIMLRPESYELSGNTLGKLCELLTTLRTRDISPFNRSAFQKLSKLLNEDNNPQVKVLNQTHHELDDTIGYAQAEDIRKFWKEKLQQAFVNAFRLAADFDAYGGTTRLFASEENIIAFPNGHTDRIKALQITSSGVAAAAESDGLFVGDGQIVITEWDQPKKITLFKHSAYRLNAGTLDPVAGIGDIVLVQDFGTPQSLNLTVTAIGNKLYARRINEIEDHTGIVILTAQATDPYALPEPVIALENKISPRKIVGTFFTGNITPPPVDDGNEVTAIDDFATVEAYLKDIELFEVIGRSMEPVALNGQFVMTRNEPLDTATLKRLNGELVIAVDQNGGIYFKRLRLHQKLVVLESANSSLTTSSEILSLEPNSNFSQLTSLKSVVGVLFDLPG